MERILLKAGDEKSEIVIRPGFSFDKEFNKDNTVIITDENIFELYRERLISFPCYILPAGEKNKNLSNVQKIYSFLFKNKVDRSYNILGFGGGVVTDITGYVAATFKRGAGLTLVPTSLIGMADAAIGGKNGVNFRGTKNLIGTFKQPEIVIIDPDFLKTLSQNEFKSGIAEVIKTTVIGNKELFEYIIDKSELIKNQNKQILDKVIFATAGIKAAIVEKDPHDKGLRQFLNFGHTIGHAVESRDKFQKIIHGEAVSLGMMASVMISVMRSYLPIKDMEEIAAALEFFGLPLELDNDRTKLIRYIKSDKKRAGKKLNLILLKGIGNPFIKQVTIDELKDMINDLP